MLRIERAIQTLKAWKESPAGDIDSITVYKGDFSSPSDAKKNGKPERKTLPWFLASKDDRWLISFDAEVPTASEGYTFFMEVSTGREGEWDAVNPQLLAFVNGEVVCGLDVNHRLVRMRPEWLGTRLDIGLHLYTGMSQGDIRLRIRFIRRAAWIHDAYYDLKVAKDACEAIPASSDESAVIRGALLEGVYRLRLNREDCPETKASIENLSRYLAAELYGKTSAMARYTVHALGHTHIDVAWLWDLRQTAEKVARSFSTALELQKSYPNYKFMASQPVLYEMLEEKQPSVFSGIKESHENGLWEAEGAMYLEADCNLIGGESMIRQIERGQDYFIRHFGKASRTLWLPDVFGYSAAMPQILRGFGIELFVTSKISWNETNKLPFDSFRWRGIDGSEMPTQFITTASMQTLGKGEFKTVYEGNCNASETLGSILRHQQRDIQPNAIMPFGYGDGGGGATEEMLENAKRLARGLPGMPTLRISHVADFLADFQKTPAHALPVWSGELYLEYHRGTYTTNGGIKQRHRRLENSLLTAERLRSIIGSLSGVFSESDAENFAQVLDSAWKTLLLNQFHDILPGTSVKRVYDEAYAQLDESIKQVGSEVTALLKKCTDGSPGCVTFHNRHAHAFSGIAVMPEGTRMDAEHLLCDNRRWRLQREPEGDTLVAIDGLAPLSFCPARLEPAGVTEASAAAGFLEAQDCPKLPIVFATPFYRIAMDEDGCFTSLHDIEANRELIRAGGKGNRVCAYEDRPLRWDAWDINEDYRRFPLPFDGPAKIRVVQDGPVALIIGVNRQIGASTIEQRLYFYKTIRRIDFKTVISWRERQVLLRTEFDLELNATEARYDIQFGNVKRPVDSNHGYNSAMFEVCAAHWGDLSEDDYGAALMSDDKFGYSSRGSTLGLSLLKSPTWPNEDSDQGEHRFSYALLPHRGDAMRGGVHREALSFALPPLSAAGNLTETRLSASWLSGLPENLSLESMRTLDEGIIELRLVEHCNRRGTATVSFARPLAEMTKTTLGGTAINSIKPHERHAEIKYAPFEILTFKLKES